MACQGEKFAIQKIRVWFIGEHRGKIRLKKEKKTMGKKAVSSNSKEQRLARKSRELEKEREENLSHIYKPIENVLTSSNVLQFFFLLRCLYIHFLCFCLYEYEWPTTQPIVFALYISVSRWYKSFSHKFQAKQ